MTSEQLEQVYVVAITHEPPLSPTAAAERSASQTAPPHHHGMEWMGMECIMQGGDAHARTCLRPPTLTVRTLA